MSRGPGRIQRLLLAELRRPDPEHPRDRIALHLGAYYEDGSNRRDSVERAAAALRRKGLATGAGPILEETPRDWVRRLDQTQVSAGESGESATLARAYAHARDCPTCTCVPPAAICGEPVDAETLGWQR
ncbi:hypothetical protein MYK68_18595 [Gordonia sp. PP30]|uniref:hypothetical protein n=1 Tax=Gordonia sp. PP30 TaxID=2935861 RepID=UPI001FFFCCB7|nr:hypothetical protein [Gordonia sp. PP30]UQE74694.1 hypothetical protein MYK68_18595 [Gordonia sp. PP30]